MKRQTVSANIRFDLENEADRRAWEYLQARDKRQYHSYSKAVIAAVNESFSRRERLAADPYLETREKEDAFLQRVLETIETGLRHAAPNGAADALVQLLQGVPAQPVSMGGTETEDQQEEDDAALDFIDSF